MPAHWLRNRTVSSQNPVKESDQLPAIVNTWNFGVTVKYTLAVELPSVLSIAR